MYEDGNVNTITTQRSAIRSLRHLAGLLLGALALLASPSSLSAVYQCADASGVVSFTDKACPDQVAGAVVDVPQVNVDYGYPERAVSKVRARAHEQARTFRRQWQLHNTAVERADDKRELRRHRQYRQLQDPVAVPRSARKSKSPYSVKRGY